MRLTWPTAIGRGYQVEGSTNGTFWVPVSAWNQATTTTMTNLLSAPVHGAPYLFRVEVRP
jgi:hypothetical protein